LFPAQLSKEITQGLKAFVTTGFSTDTPYFKGMFERFVEEEGALMKGPWLSLGLPFLQGDRGHDFFSTFKTQYPPYLHQQQAWERISSDKMGRSTLVATGTGSGKTECFLYPLLDHCSRHSEKGIKAIVIYPMNALATDQAKRFAKEIDQAEKLKGKVRVGLFVGGKEEHPAKAMSSVSVITDKDTLREDPPDILLTNYKMLDFLLLRPRDRKLWRYNQADTLRYLVVDELHTFDGAQGTDLACLIRRLRGRLVGKDQESYLISVGTSATLGSGAGARALTEYAKQVFRSEFDQQSVITEQRQGTEQFLTEPIEFVLHPVDEWVEIDGVEGWKEYFFPDQQNLSAVDLGRLLKRHLLFNNLLRLLSRTPLSSLNELTGELSKTVPQGAARDHSEEILNGLYQLVSVAKGADGQPLVNLRLQLWSREMRRMVTPLLSDPPRLGYADDLQQGEKDLYLPLVQCNHCNATAWLSRVEGGESTVSSDLRKIYQGWFGNDPESLMLFPLKEGEEPPLHDGRIRYLCKSCGYLQSEEGRCSGCSEEGVQRVYQPILQRTRRVGGAPQVVTEHNCAMCGMSDSMMVFGARSATLSSVMIHHLYASDANDDKKLITFSDSVQDAAHHAGFFSARTWQNLIRLAMVQAMPQEEIGLLDYYQRLPQYWLDSSLNPEAMSREQFVSEFIAPNMAWYRDYLAMVELDDHMIPEGSHLVADVSKRLEWEAFAEFGYQSRVGRSLEQTGSIAVGVRAEPIQQSAVELREQLIEEEGLHHLTERMVQDFVVGLLLHTREQGGIDHRFARSYIETGSIFQLGQQTHRQHHMPGFAKRSRAPIYLTDAPSHQQFESIRLSRKRSWLVGWMFRALAAEGELLPEGIEKSLLPISLRLLVEQGLLVAYEGEKGATVWALNPEQLYLSRSVAVFETENARDRLYLPDTFATLVRGLPSLVLNDHGHYRDGASRDSWLSSLYEKGEIRRINAKEHTGLLERDERQAIERDFMGGDYPWSCNLLSATPTLEMGIDIGDLSSLLLCSVPPAQANYLQRIGRAGRRDGNALAMTVAAGSPHDLYFYADPLLMMDGDVEPPGVFLNASAVISRQLTAYCMDRWVESGIDESAIPKRMKPVLDGVGLGALDQFPQNFTGFVNKNASQLLDGFLKLFEGEFSNYTEDRLHEFIMGEGEEDGLEMRLIKRLHEMVDERDGFVRKIKDLKNALQRLKRLPKDEATLQEIDAVERERGSLQAMLRSMNRRQPLNVLTDEGLLPNYAFPEEGVMLRSVIYRKRVNPKEGEPAFENSVYEYERPGAAAIRELLPNSKFYAGERKVEIEQVDLDLSAMEQWRFCPNCTHSASDKNRNEQQLAECPKCGDPMWSDAGQLLEMIRLRQVMANSDDRKSRIGDDSDTREPSFHVRQMLADFEGSAVKQAYRIKGDSVPFGFEFIQKASFREINFGEYGASGEEHAIAGVEAVRPGFMLCRHCGMVQDATKLNRGEKQKHSYTCSARKSHPDEESNLIDCLYLYREFDSEALRILLPMSAMEDGDRSLNSFIAGLQLGLKLKFGGKVDHLRVTSYSAPETATTAERRFLMLYDSVPGGTGYLQQLMEPLKGKEEHSLPMIEVFELARDHMSRCDCNRDPEKDGCYRCLYAYRNSHGMETTSRNRAVELFGQIIEKRDQIEALETIDDIEINPILESELEARFIGAIRTAAMDGLEVQIQQQVVNGKPGYFLRVTNAGGGDSLYTIEPQVNLSPSDGVTIPSKPDFMIRSAQPSSRGADFLPVALFLDGFKYHKEIIAEDSGKRLAIVQSGKYRVWSLTWDDVQAQYAKTKMELGNPFSHGLHDSMRGVQKQAMEGSLGISTALFQLPLKSPFEQLLRFLGEPNSERMMGLMMVRMLSWFDQSKMVESRWINATKEQMLRCSPSGFQDVLDDVEGTVACGGMDLDRLHLSCMMPLDAIQKIMPEKVMTSICLDDDFTEGETVEKKIWHGFLSLYNLIQFLPLTLFATNKGVRAGLYEEISWNAGVSADNFDEALYGVELQQVLDEVSPQLSDGLLQLNAHGCEVPEVGYEFMNASGEVTGAMAELAWPGLKVAGLLEGEALSLPDSGWKSVLLDGSGAWVESVMDQLEEAG